MHIELGKALEIKTDWMNEVRLKSFIAYRNKRICQLVLK
jgi:hypothetical protein